MQKDITLKERGRTEVLIDGRFVLDEELLRAEVLRLGSGSTVKGFRPGKAPYEILKNMFYDKAKSNVVRKTIDGMLFELSQDKNIKFVGKPDISWSELESGIISFSVVSERMPEFDIAKYKGVRVKKPNFKVTDEEFKNAMEEMREFYSFVEDTDKNTPDEDDIVLVDMIITSSDGKENRYEGKHLNVGKQNEWLRKIILSMKVGEQRNLNIYNEEYGDTKIKITLHKVKKRVYPSTDEELARSAGFENFEDFSQDIKNKLEKRVKERERHHILMNIISTLVEENNIEIPKSMVEEEIRFLKRENRTANISPNDLVVFANFNVMRRVILDYVIKKENMKVTDDEVQNFINDFSEREGIPVEKIKSSLDDAAMKDIATQVLYEKAGRLLIDTAELYS